MHPKSILRKKKSKAYNHVVICHGIENLYELMKKYQLGHPIFLVESQIKCNIKVNSSKTIVIFLDI